MSNDDLERMELLEPAAYKWYERADEFNDYIGSHRITTEKPPVSASGTVEYLFNIKQVNAIILADRQRRHVDPDNTSAGCVKESEDFAHEIWAAAQLIPGEGIEDGVGRISALLAERAQAAEPVGYFVEVAPGRWDQAVHPVKDRQYLRDMAIVCGDDPDKAGEGIVPLYRAAPVEVTEAMIERGLRAAEQAAVEYVLGTGDFDVDFTDNFKDRFRKMHRAALEAALGGGDA